MSLEFANPSAINGSSKKSAKPPDELVEMRFYVPGSRMKGADSDEDEEGQKEKKKEKKKKAENGDGSDKEGTDKEESDKQSSAGEEDEDQNAAQQFHSLIRERASLTSQTAAGSLLISFDEVLVTTPRGRYDVAMYQSFLRWVVLWTSIDSHRKCLDSAAKRTTTKSYTTALLACFYCQRTSSTFNSLYGHTWIRYLQALTEF